MAVFVVPAQAGIHLQIAAFWMPTFAGMTGVRLLRRLFHNLVVPDDSSPSRLTDRIEDQYGFSSKRCGARAPSENYANDTDLPRNWKRDRE